MKILFSSLITYLLFVTIFCSTQPPLWPQWFSQSMIVNFPDLNTTGSYWYDSEIGAQRYDYANGNTFSGCGSVHRINTPCTNLIRDGWFFMIYPQKNLCCKLYEAKPTRRNWLQDYTFKSQQNIDGIIFNVWDLNLGSQQTQQLFYTQAEGQQRPRRQTVGGKIYFDYWLNSYNRTKPKQNIFDIPSYCQKRCWDQFQNEQQYKQLLKKMRQYHKGILMNQEFINVKCTWLEDDKGHF